MNGLPNLQSFRSNVTSQFGEDGILTEILLRIGDGNRRCVEFGAWDGKHFSNTWNLWHERGWSALLIEGNEERWKTLLREYGSLPRIKPLCAYVGLTGENRLEAILEREGWTDSLDVLSIDIDGDDYHVFASLNLPRPRIVVVEFNPTCPPGAEVVQAPGGSFGCSATSLNRLAQSKGYSLAACTDTNLILVRVEEYPKLRIPEIKLSEVEPLHHLTYVMTDYGGNTYINRIPVYKEALDCDGFAYVFKRKKNLASFQCGSPVPIRVVSSK